MRLVNRIFRELLCLFKKVTHCRGIQRQFRFETETTLAFTSDAKSYRPAQEFRS